MKRLLSVVAVVSLLATVVPTRADLAFTFDTGVDGFTNIAWSAGGPAGWPDAAAVKATSASGGWTMGATGPFKPFPWNTGEQLAMQALANVPTARLDFDVILDGTSFPAGAAGWYQVHMAGNSDGTSGWTQQKVVDGWHDADDATLLVTHVDLPIAKAGWEAGDTWFQLYFGTNSDAAFPVAFYLDNVTITVPEPASALLLLGGFGVVAFRRRRVL
ncbi:MAG TPA: PEP-CTERM sorting domain-containing protein [Phycisphaerae bacterium]|nr:PEP-CTERM sorting domain-containing protein [Phycisphaerae bacterium]HRY68109.1 PEP-CTERM sorting domain-containing protein [Phycisphaerae bacterium]HSA28808.1 PEP-CTERM sorting domain-containing protein [Phycisphaerae bacterium]